ncbi:MAG: hypothetical protein EA406_01270 [Rhodospirillales bacterium]|nr:MAG: hypothetical protein EA406_01270 [Rhodospirillales bacterium]
MTRPRVVIDGIRLRHAGGSATDAARLVQVLRREIARITPADLHRLQGCRTIRVVAGPGEEARDWVARALRRGGGSRS